MNLKIQWKSIFWEQFFKKAIVTKLIEIYSFLKLQKELSWNDKIQ